MVTVLWNVIRKVFAAAFALSVVAVIGIFTIHEILKIRFPCLSLCALCQCYFFRCIDRWTIKRKRLVFIAVIHIPSSAIRGVRRHSLVKWLAFMLTMGDESHCNAKPFSFDADCKGFAVVPLMSVREITQGLKRHLQLVILFRKGFLPYCQRSVVHPAVYCVKCLGTDGGLNIVRVSNIGYTQSAARKSREGWRFAKQIRPDLD